MERGDNKMHHEVRFSIETLLLSAIHKRALVRIGLTVNQMMSSWIRFSCSTRKHRPAQPTRIQRKVCQVSDGLDVVPVSS